jgi:hypothetical protein
VQKGGGRGWVGRLGLVLSVWVGEYLPSTCARCVQEEGGGCVDGWMDGWMDGCVGGLVRKGVGGWQTTGFCIALCPAVVQNNWRVVVDSRLKA